MLPRACATRGCGCQFVRIWEPAGVAPNVAGRVSTPSFPPGAHGGNIDNWRIGAGSTMYYPVAVDGALFSVGDPHISQGDGEISGTALESSLNGLLRLTIRRIDKRCFPRWTGAPT